MGGGARGALGGLAVTDGHARCQVQTRTPDVRRAARTQRVREYFYGVHGDGAPFSARVPFADVDIYRVVPVEAGHLPVGTAGGRGDALRTMRVGAAREMEHCLAAVSASEDGAGVMGSPVHGFVVMYVRLACGAQVVVGRWSPDPRA